MMPAFFVFESLTAVRRGRIRVVPMEMLLAAGDFVGAAVELETPRTVGIDLSCRRRQAHCLRRARPRRPCCRYRRRHRDYSSRVSCIAAAGFHTRSQ
jgi:hypothetical protein